MSREICFSHFHSILILFYLSVLMVKDREFQFDQWQGGCCTPLNPLRGCQPPLVFALEFIVSCKLFLLLRNQINFPSYALQSANIILVHPKCEMMFDARSIFIIFFVAPNKVPILASFFVSVNWFMTSLLLSLQLLHLKTIAKIKIK